MAERAEKIVQGVLPSDFTYLKRINPRAKRVILRINHRDGLVVTVPKGLSKKELDLILVEKTDWILAGLEVAARRKLEEIATPPPQLIEIPLFDQRITVDYDSWQIQKIAIDINDPSHITVTHPDVEPAIINRIITKWLVGWCTPHMDKLVREVAHKRGLEVAKVGVRLQKNLWGSCSANSNISMNLRTAFLAKEFGLFVIDHELAHLTHHNHSADFYRLLEERQPEAKRLNSELKKVGATVPSWLS